MGNFLEFFFPYVNSILIFGKNLTTSWYHKVGKKKTPDPSLKKKMGTKKKTKKKQKNPQIALI
jgi:hypothetical protein